MGVDSNHNGEEAHKNKRIAVERHFEYENLEYDYEIAEQERLTLGGLETKKVL